VINDDSELVGTAIRDLGKGDHVFVLSHGRNSEPTFFPTGDMVLEAGDQITVQAEPGALRRIHQINHDPEPY
jgi:Trk K+ transport system NAD-binding subunit